MKLLKVAKGLQTDVERFAYAFFEAAKANLEKDKALAPTAFFIFPGNGLDVIGLEFESPEEKESLLRCMADRALGKGAQALLFLSEAWLRTSGKPGRQEAILFLVVTQRGRPRWVLSQVFTRKKGQIVFPEPLKKCTKDLQFFSIPKWEIS